MTTKDWILLLVPIVLNGAFIYIFQQWAQLKIGKIKDIEERKKEIVNSFLPMIVEALEVTTKIQVKYKNRVDLEEILEVFKNSISDLCRYGINLDNVFSMEDELEELRFKSGLYYGCLLRYNDVLKTYYVFNGKLLEEHLEIEKYYSDILTLLKKAHNKAIKL